ncbi:MAG: DNA repair protein RecN [Acidobacteria bacterium]|nr:DNA repair protein RecN [Acidobacteriota bacterium]MBV9478034.1 DNA repair protein RecN [Acidobacteriota bacterium]
MITYLKVRNLAIVEELAIEPGPGLNVLTGETGAGKSLLIDSLEFLRGARGSTEMIRAGSDKMTAEAVVQLPAALAPALEELGIDTEVHDDAIELIVRREIAASGRGRVLVNGSPIAVRELAAAMDAVLEIHGQHESQQRVAGQTYRELVDEYGGHDALVDATRAAYREWRLAADQLEEITNAQRDRALRLDLLKYQLDEISAAKLDPAEEETLRGERAILSHARELIETTSGAFQLVDEDESSAIAQLGRALHLLQPLAKQIDEVRQLAGDMQDALYRLQDLSRTLANLSESTRLDPERLEQIEDRLVTIERLRKKYGGSVEAALEHLGRIQDEYERLADYEASVEKLQQAEAARQTTFRKAAEKLSASRKKTARAFEQAIQKELDDLAMERTTVRVELSPRDASPDGIDRIDILIAPNRGEEPKPMQRIASGGELSRIQLAIAAALFKASTRAAAATLVFDEIDAGIGGRVAEVVGRKLQELSARNQVVCVTHLPQIASFGATHFYVWKEDAGGHTRARIERLDDGERRVRELARMLGGESVSASAIAHARELLRAGSHATKVRA